jgi:CheY-like chemotaxis protein
MRVLMADDEQGFRDLFRFALEPLGHEVVTVCTGAEAVGRFMAEPFDLVVLDHHMPCLSGLEALVQIVRHTPGQKVLLISASAGHMPALEKDAVALGAVRCLAKPLELEELVSAVELQLQRKVA